MNTSTQLLPARQVRIASVRRPLRVPLFFRIDRIGQYIPGVGRVVFSRPPPPVYVTYTTSIEFVKECKVKHEELRHNILVKVYYPSTRSRSYYIYPKAVWERVWRDYLEPMSRGDPPKEPGLLLYGPKGTGKTSAIKIISDYLGLYMVSIDPSILSKYIGESEQRLLSKLSEAEQCEPSIVNMDEMDSLVRKRDVVGMGGGEGAQTYLNIIAILLRKLPEYKQAGRRILVVLATNVSPSMIDDAFLRHERFGTPIFVPPPDYEAIRTYLQLHELDKILSERELDSLAYQLSAVGVSMADVAKIVEEVKESKKLPDLSHLSKLERGYRRPYPARLVDIDSRLLEPVLDMFRPFTRGQSRLVVHTSGYNYRIVEMLIIYILAKLCVPAVVLTDYRKLDEAEHTAETCNAVLIAPADYMPRDILQHLHLNCKTPLWFISSTALGDIPMRSVDQIERRLGAENIFKIVLSHMGIDYDETKLKRLSRTDIARHVLNQVPYRVVESFKDIEQMLRERGLAL